MARTRASLLAVFAVLFLPAAAHATTFCVNDPACAGTPVATVQSALDDAQTNAGPDTVQIGAGTFDTPSGASYNSPDPVSIVGAGTGATTLVASSEPAFTGVLTLAGSGASAVSNLHIAIGAGMVNGRAFDTVGSASNVLIDADPSADNPVGLFSTGGGTFQGLTISLPHKNFASGAATFVGPGGLLQDSSLDADSGVFEDSTSGTLTIHRVTIRSAAGVTADPGNVSIDDSLLLVVPGPSNQETGLETSLDPPTIDANHLTIVGPGTPDSRGLWTLGAGTINLRNSTVTGFAHSLVRDTGGGNINTAYSNYPETRIDDSGGSAITETDHIDVAPGFVSPAAGDYRLAAGSPLIDAGDPAGLSASESATDLAGNPRIAGSRRDIGAYEFQPPPPPADVTPPKFTGVSETNKVFAVGNAPTPLIAKRAKPKRGTTFRYTLSEDATVKLAIQRKLKGRRVGNRCRKPSRHSRGKACTRFVKKGTLTRHGKAGPNSVPFSGRIGRRALRPGRYRVLIAATDAAGNASKPATLSFRIVPGRAAHR